MEKVEEVETAFASENTEKLLKLIRVSVPRRPSVSEAISEADGTLIYNKSRMLERWAEHFEGQFSWPPASAVLRPQICSVVCSSVGLVLSTNTEVRRCISALKRNRAAAVDYLVPAFYTESGGGRWGFDAVVTTCVDDGYHPSVLGSLDNSSPIEERISDLAKTSGEFAWPQSFDYVD